MDKFFDLLLGYLRERPYWATIEPFVLVAVGWGAFEFLAFESLPASDAFKPSVGLFLRSYLFWRIAIGALAIAAILMVTKPRRQNEAALTPAARFAAYWWQNWSWLLRRTLAIALILAAAAIGFQVVSPSRVSQITVRFMSLPPDVTPEGLAYVIYELNRRQRQWYFDLDFGPFRETQTERCQDNERRQFCDAQTFSEGKPFIGITRESLGGAYFASHLDAVSVISTADSEDYAPLSNYEYLAFSLIVQAILIHLDLSGGLPEGTFAEGHVSHGGVFQFVPEKPVLKSTMLAARLSPDEEALLLNKFGDDYVATCADLLTMEWFYTSRVRNNLEKVFGAKIGRL